MNSFVRSFRLALVAVLSVSLALPAQAFTNSICKAVIAGETGTQVAVDMANEESAGELTKYLDSRHRRVDRLMEFLYRQRMRWLVLQKSRYASKYGDIRLKAHYYSSAEFRAKKLAIEERIREHESDSVRRSAALSDQRSLMDGYNKFIADIESKLSFYKTHEARLKATIYKKDAITLRYRLLKAAVKKYDEASFPKPSLQLKLPNPDLINEEDPATHKVSVVLESIRSYGELKDLLRSAETDMRSYRRVEPGGTVNASQTSEIEDQFAEVEYALETFADIVYKRRNDENLDRKLKTLVGQVKHHVMGNGVTLQASSRAVIHSIRESLKFEKEHVLKGGNQDFRADLKEQLKKLSLDSLADETINQMLRDSGYQQFNPGWLRKGLGIFPAALAAIQKRITWVFGFAAVTVSLGYLGMFQSEAVNNGLRMIGITPIGDKNVVEVETPQETKDIIERLSVTPNFEKETQAHYEAQFPDVIQSIQEGTEIDPQRLTEYQAFTAEVLLARIDREVLSNNLTNSLSEDEKAISKVIMAEETARATELIAKVLEVSDKELSGITRLELAEVLDDLGTRLTNSEKTLVIQWYLGAYGEVGSLDGQLHPQALKIIEAMVELRGELAQLEGQGFLAPALEAQAQARIRQILIEIYSLSR